MTDILEVSESRSLILEAVDDGLLVLGESGRHALYYQVEKRFGINREEIPYRIDDFHKALESMFGPPCKILERIIAKELYSKLGLRFKERKSWTLSDYLEEIKTSKVRV